MRRLARRTRVVNAIDNPISPRGDGNLATRRQVFHAASKIDNPISPRGDGNSSNWSDNRTPRVIDNPISPRGDGNPLMIGSIWSTNTRIDNPISPRGDGNSVAAICKNDGHAKSITLFPREGTETFRRALRCPIGIGSITLFPREGTETRQQWYRQSCPVTPRIDNPISPRGDGNAAVSNVSRTLTNR